MTNTETHPSPGMRSHWPVIPAIRLLWTIMTPLGLPVEPLVYITTARSEGWGFTITLPTARQTKLYCICDTFQPQIWLRITTKVRQKNTHYCQAACPALVRPACCGWTVPLGGLLCSLSSGPRRSHASVLESVKAHSGQKKEKATITTGTQEVWWRPCLILRVTTCVLCHMLHSFIHAAAHKKHLYFSGSVAV